jgi:transcriptional antiterminator RfaH
MQAMKLSDQAIKKRLIASTPTPVLPASFPLGRAWFVVAVWGNSEKTAAKDIEDMGFGIFYPTETRQKLRRGRKVMSTDPVFPGYLFVHFDRERDEWGAINDVDGVVGILKNGVFPSRIPDLVIDRLMNMVAAGAFETASKLNGGDTVEITEGHFAGLLAKVKSASPRKRVKVLLDGLGALEIDPCFLRKV